MHLSETFRILQNFCEINLTKFSSEVQKFWNRICGSIEFTVLQILNISAFTNRCDYHRQSHWPRFRISLIQLNSGISIRDLQFEFSNEVLIESLRNASRPMRFSSCGLCCIKIIVYESCRFSLIVANPLRQTSMVHFFGLSTLNCLFEFRTGNAFKSVQNSNCSTRTVFLNRSNEFHCSPQFAALFWFVW